MIFSSEYSIPWVALVPIMIYEKVRIPTLPKIIIRMIQHLPQRFNTGVIPMDKPTVPKADTVSKR